MAGAEVEFREATALDLNELIELAMDDAPDRPDAAALASVVQCDCLDRQDLGEVEFYVAERKGDIIGQLVLRLPDKPDRFGRADRSKFADIEEVRVVTGCRGQGIGGEMMDYVEWQCMREGIDQIGVAVDLGTQARAAEWFERLDYVRVGEPYEVEDPSSDEGQAGSDANRRTLVDLVKEF